MKSKIEKLEDNIVQEGISEMTASWTPADNRQLQDKLNEVIDYLNSQSQPEDYDIKIDARNCTSTDMEKEEYYKELGRDLLKQDTPEEKEEFFGRFVGNIKSPDWDTWRRQDPHVVWDFIKQLLEDKDEKIQELEDKIYDMRCERDEED